MEVCGILREAALWKQKSQSATGTPEILPGLRERQEHVKTEYKIPFSWENRNANKPQAGYSPADQTLDNLEGFIYLFKDERITPFHIQKPSSVVERNEASWQTRMLFAARKKGGFVSGSSETNSRTQENPPNPVLLCYCVRFIMGFLQWRALGVLHCRLRNEGLDGSLCSWRRPDYFVNHRTTTTAVIGRWHKLHHRVTQPGDNIKHLLIVGACPESSDTFSWSFF